MDMLNLVVFPSEIIVSSHVPRSGQISLVFSAIMNPIVMKFEIHAIGRRPPMMTGFRNWTSGKASLLK